MFRRSEIAKTFERYVCPSIHPSVLFWTCYSLSTRPSHRVVGRIGGRSFKYVCCLELIKRGIKIHKWKTCKFSNVSFTDGVKVMFFQNWHFEICHRMSKKVEIKSHFFLTFDWRKFGVKFGIHWFFCAKFVPFVLCKIQTGIPGRWWHE